MIKSYANQKGNKTILIAVMYMTVDTENPEEFSKKLWEIVNKYSKIQTANLIHKIPSFWAAPAPLVPFP